MAYSIPKGVYDIFPNEPLEKNHWKEAHRWEYLHDFIRNLVKTYGYEEISTPIFEKTELFSRSIGSGTDIVSKEMYTFEDKGGRSLSLRPEGTAPVMRAFIEKQLHNTSYINKLFYFGSMFRYERQQAGRYRQFYQLGVEAVGLPSPEQDAEVIDMLYTLFSRLGLKNLNLFINSIGDLDCRSHFKKELVKYLTPHSSKLSPESQNRLKVNPLRILDSKIKEDQKLLEKAPSILDFLEEAAKEHYEGVLKCLKSLKIPYVTNHKLVRGLDYYNRSVFEIVCGDLGAQDTIGAGGRYDYLLKDLGGPDLPAVGFAVGFERILQTMLTQGCPFPKKHRPKVLLIPLGEEASEVSFTLLKKLREENVSSEMDFSGKKLKTVMKYADKREIPYVAIIGESELQANEIILKEMNTGKENKIKINEVVRTLKNLK